MWLTSNSSSEAQPAVLVGVGNPQPHPQPLAFARATVARIEQEKPARPSSCFDLSRAIAKLEEKHKDDPEVKALGQKAKSLCP